MWAEITIWRVKKVISESGIKKTALYARIKNGLWTPSVRLGGILVGWPAREIAILNAARIAGRSEQEIRDLVVKLVAERAGADQP